MSAVHLRPLMTNFYGPRPSASMRWLIDLVHRSHPSTLTGGRVDRPRAAVYVHGSIRDIIRAKNECERVSNESLNTGNVLP